MRGVNWLAVVVSAIVYWMLGALWYGAFFQRAWLHGLGVTMEQLNQLFAGTPTWIPYVISFVCNLILAYALAWIIAATGTQTFALGMRTGLMLWVGFVATTMLTEYVFEHRSLQLFDINSGYVLVGMLIMGGILGAWKQPARRA